MKRIFSILMLALLLIPALAAAEIPAKLTTLDPQQGEPFELSLGNGSCRYVVHGTHGGNEYRATYFLSGDLEEYKYTFDCECEVTFSHSGVIKDGSIKRRIGGSTYTWNETQNAWVSRSGNKNTDHPFNASEHKAPVAYTQSGKAFPADLGSDFAALKASTYGAFPQNLDNAAGTVVSSKDEEGLLLIGKDGMYALYADEKLVEVYSGKLFFNDYWGEKDCRLQGDPTYGVYNQGFYDWETGKLYQYKIYDDEWRMNSVYSVKNVLRSTEVFDSEGAHWFFPGDVWLYDKNCTRDYVEKEPTAEVLEMILRAPGPVEYESACVTSESQLKEEDKGAPYILADKSAINNATVQTRAEQIDARTMKYDINLMSGGKKVSLASPVTLTLGYPAGVTKDLASNSKDFHLAVRHTTDSGEVEIMSTLDGTIKLTDNGPQVTATSFSPYEVIWGSETELAWAKNASAKTETGSLPKTGDDSQMLFFAALLVVSCAAMAMMSKRRVKE